MNKSKEEILKGIYDKAPKNPTPELMRMYILQAMEIYKQQNEHCDCEQYHHTYTVTLEKCEHCDNVLRKKTTGQKVETFNPDLMLKEQKT